MPDSRVVPGDPALERALRRSLRGEVRFDAFTRGLYSTDASHYQIEPLGVVFPRSVEDVEATLALARERGVPVLPRGGGTSQCGQTIGRAIVMDTSRHLTRIGAVEGGAPHDGRRGTQRPPPQETRSGADPSSLGGAVSRAGDLPTHVEVEPGVVLDRLNAYLRPYGVWFPVDPSTGSRATLGGMAGNNSAGARSIRYGMMADNVSALDIVLPDGRTLRVGEGGRESEAMPDELAALRALFARERDEIERRAPKTMRDVAGYGLARLHPDRESVARLLVGSEGTLAFFSRIRLQLSPLPRHRVLGVAHFDGLVDALDAVQHIVRLEPSAVELVDDTVLRLAAENPDFRSAMATFVRGEPGALLLVEFAADDQGADLRPRLAALEEVLAELGHTSSVVRAVSPGEQANVWSVRKAGLNIVMSMAGPRKPISFIEDCAVPLEHLAEYARRVDEIFRRHGTDGTWYAHASVGCLHVRPAIDLKDPDDVGLVRRIAEETHAVVRELGGTHSGEHGDGILRSEFLRTMLGDRLTDAFEEVKRTFDPAGIMNPGKIVDPPRMDDRSLLRYKPGYAARPLPVVLDWSATDGPLGAVERCNNNGACRKIEPGVMCPSFRVTRDERHSTRGRANALRLALTGQLGDDGLDSPEMAEALSLCISCKACRRECPAGVDMAKLKLEWQHRRNGANGVRLRERVLAALPRIAPRASRAGPLLNLASRSGAQRLLGIAGGRALPRWHARPWRDDEVEARADVAHPATRGDRTTREDGTTRGNGARRRDGAPPVALFVDTFTRWFEPEAARAAVRLFRAGGASVLPVADALGGRPLCCGRTWLSAGMLDEAREEAKRLLDVVVPLARAGMPIVGLEPSCLYTLRDEIPALLPGEDSEAVAAAARMLEEHLVEAWDGGRPLPLRSAEPGEVRVLVHGHCHQKAFGGHDATLALLRRIPGLEVEAIESGCCGMAGAFGYHAEHHETSLAMGELGLLPAVRAAEDSTRIVAGGTSCRAQIADGTGRRAEHPAVVLAEALAEA
jgi:FAD/FMN-containing dehydrogenase/Fe-S oxidoreductase